MVATVYVTEKVYKDAYDLHMYMYDESCHPKKINYNYIAMARKIRVLESVEWNSDLLPSI